VKNRSPPPRKTAIGRSDDRGARVEIIEFDIFLKFTNIYRRNGVFLYRSGNGQFSKYHKTRQLELLLKLVLPVTYLKTLNDTLSIYRLIRYTS